MRRVWLLGWNDLRLTMRDRTAFVWLLAMPLALMWFFGSMNLGGGGGGPNPVALTVVDHDGGWLADALLDELADDGLDMRRHTPETAPPREARTRTLVIPAGFTERVAGGEAQTLRLEKEPGSSVQYGMAAQVFVVRAIVRTLGRLVELGDDVSMPDVAAERYRDLVDREPLVRLDVSSAGRGRPVPTGMAQSVPGNLTFLVMMMTLIYGGVFLTIEKASGMLRRQGVAPMSRSQIFLGKLFGRVLIASVQIVPLILAGRFLFGLDLGRSPLGLAAVLASYALCVAGMATLLGAVLSTPAQASSVGWIGAMVLAAMGGCWWPAELMPDWMRQVAVVFPTTWAMDAFHALISFGQGLSEVWTSCLVLVGFAVVFSAIGARLLRLDPGRSA